MIVIVKNLQSTQNFFLTWFILSGTARRSAPAAPILFFSRFSVVSVCNDRQHGRFFGKKHNFALSWFTLNVAATYSAADGDSIVVLCVCSSDD